MKSKLLLLALTIVVTCCAWGQYTPLPPLSETGYESFVSALKEKAKELDLPELETIANSMSYNEARRFLANPHVFAERLKNEVKPDPNSALDPVRIGIIVNLLISHLGGLTGDYKSAAKLGYSLGLYAMFVFGTIYFMPELLFMYRPAGEKIGDYHHILKITYLSLFLNFMYVMQGQTFRWMFGLGPAFSYGLSGKEKTTMGNNTDESSLEFGEDGLRRFQAGLNFQAGVLIRNAWLIYIGYTWYFTKLFSGNSDIIMNSFRLGFGYTFGGKK